MSRHRTPTSLLETSGAFDKDPARRDARGGEPVPSGPLGAPPEHLTPSQQTIWLELADQVPDGVLTISDRMFLEITCSLMSRHREGKAEGRTLKAAEYNLIISCLARMGLTPADRSRVVANPDGKKDDDDPFARLARNGRGTAKQ